MNSLILSEKLYARIKWAVQIVLPSISALYVGLAQLYSWGAVDQVVGTIALVTVFLGATLGLSSKNYNNSDAAFDGDMLVTTTAAGSINASLDLRSDPHDIVNKSTVSFKVKDERDYAGMDLG